MACLWPVCGVPAWLTGGSLTLLLRVRLVVQQTVVVADDGQHGAEFLDADDISLDHAVTARNRALSTSHITSDRYSLDFSRPITTAETSEAVDWRADLPQRTWPQAGRTSDVILKSTAAILAADMFVGDRTTASTSLAGAADMRPTHSPTHSISFHFYSTYSYSVYASYRKITAH